MTAQPFSIGDTVAFDQVVHQINRPNLREWGAEPQSGSGEVVDIFPAFIEDWVERARDWKRTPIGDVLEVATRQGTVLVYSGDARLG